MMHNVKELTCLLLKICYNIDLTLDSFAGLLSVTKTKFEQSKTKTFSLLEMEKKVTEIKYNKKKHSASR